MSKPIQASDRSPDPLSIVAVLESARLITKAPRGVDAWTPARFGARVDVEDAPRATLEPTGPLPPRSTPYQVLVVDDEPDILTSLKTCLEAEFPNVRVLTAESGLEALHLMDKEPVDLIITDYKMPGMDGFELLAKAERIAPMVPRILITAYAVDVPVVSTEIFRVRHFFSKPFHGDEINAAVRSELAQRA
ncbi:MAG: response regulator [Euryarchaeota archaeon]|nr:response regulator [Euryarchaeota archaeon]